MNEEITGFLPIDPINEALHACDLEVLECSALQIIVVVPKRNLYPLLLLRLHLNIVLQRYHAFNQEAVLYVLESHALLPVSFHGEVSEELEAEE